jgi:hypothetical protein
MDDKSRNVYTVDNNTLASHQGRTSVSMARWALRFPMWPVILAVLLLTSIVSFFAENPSALYLIFTASVLLIALVANLFYLRRIHEHFSYGDANPGIVVSVKPLLIATRTDLSKGHGRYPAIKVVREPRSGFAKGLKIGYRVATVALYRGDPNDGRPYWDDFFPYAVEPVAADHTEATSLLESFDMGEWQALEAGLCELEVMREGLHRIELDSSDWNNAG